MEEKSLYDKTRRITRLENGSFGVPVKNHPDFYEVTKNAPLSIRSALSCILEAETPLQSSNSLQSRIQTLLQTMCNAHSEKWNSKSVVYRRSEIIGDILVFSKTSFVGEHSGQFWSELSQLPSVFSGDALPGHWIQFFEGMTQLLKCTRVGVHHEVDCGPKRQSHSRLVYSTNNDENGWVTIRQVEHLEL